MRRNLVILLFFYQLRISLCDPDNETEDIKINVKTAQRNNVQDRLPKEIPDVTNDKLDILTQEKDIIGEQIRQSHRFLDIIDKYGKKNMTYTHYTVKDLITNIHTHVLKYAKSELGRLGDSAKNILNSSLDIDPILDDATKAYTANMKEYFDFISEKNVTHNIEYDYILFDAVEASHDIFYNVSRMLRDNILNKHNANDKHSVIKLFNKAVADEKSGTFKYICREFSVCRHQPAFSDHLAHVLEQMLSFPESDFMQSVKAIQEVVKYHSNYLKTVVAKDIAQVIDKEFSSLVKNYQRCNFYFTVVIKMIQDRFKFFHNTRNYVYISNTTKAIKLFIDVIDKTFDVLGNTQISLGFKSLNKDLNVWSETKRNDINKVLKGFWQDVVEIIKFHWNQEIREEVKTLVEVIVRGNATNQYICDILLTEGSKFIRGEDVLYFDNEVK